MCSIMPVSLAAMFGHPIEHVILIVKVENEMVAVR